jgi:preprotein translocase subunit SecG
MSLILTLVFVLTSILVCIVVLIQEGKGGGLGGAFGGAGQQTFGVGTRGITRFTAAVVVVMLLAALGTHWTTDSASRSVIEDGGRSVLDAAPGDAGGTGSVLDQNGGGAGGSAPAGGGQ